MSYSKSSPEILSNFDLSCTSGHVTVLRGPSGCGKSTLLYLMGLLLKPTSGSIEINGVKTTELRDVERAKIRAQKIGFVFQDSLLDPTRTLMANILEGAVLAGIDRSSGRAKATVLLDAVGLSGQTVGNRPPAGLSGGQAQRVALCRCLVKSPSIILADEPTGNLDTETSNVILDILQEEASNGAIVVIATHDAEVVQRADNVVDLPSTGGDVDK